MDDDWTKCLNNRSLCTPSASLCVNRIKIQQVLLTHTALSGDCIGGKFPGGIFTPPECKLQADDVSCVHGATSLTVESLGHGSTWFES